MGTRSDFYVGRGYEAEWIGSIALDGDRKSLPQKLFRIRSEKAWRRRVAELIRGCSDGTLPEQGWPWPWDDSGTTDCAYTFHEKKVRKLRTNGKGTWPNMASRRKLTFGLRSGMFVVPMKAKEPLKNG